MGVKTIIFLLFLSTFFSKALADEYLTQFWTRLNYGVAAVKDKQTCIADGYISHMIHFALPRVHNIGDPAPVNNTTCDVSCLRMTHLLTAINTMSFSMKRSITDMVDKIYILIPDIESPKNVTGGRLSRSPLDIIGTGLSYAFGVATEADIEQLKKEILDIKSFAAAAASDAADSRQGMATFTKLQNQRLDLLHEILGEQKKNIGYVVKRLQGIAEATQIELSAVSFMATEIARYAQIHDSVQEFLLGIEDLVQGRLTPKLIDLTFLTQIMKNMSAQLSQSARTLCFSTPRELLASQTFDFARHRNEIFIRLRIPYSSYDRVNIYKTMLFPLPVPGNQSLVTILQSFPLHIIYYPSQSMVGELLSELNNPIIDETDIRWHRYADQSCLFHIIYDEPEMVKLYCDFSIRKQIIEPTFVRLATGVFVLSNFSEFQIICPKQTSTKPASCGICLVNFTCGCYLKSSHGVFGSNYCPEIPTETTIRYPYNLILLQTFYDLTNYTIKGSDLSPNNDYRNASTIYLPIFEDKTTKLLNDDKDVSYSLTKLVSALQNDSIILHTPSQQLLYQLFNKSQIQPTFWTFNTYEWQSWAIGLIYMMLIIYVIGKYIKHRIHNVLPLVGASSLALPQTIAFQLKASPTTPTTTLPSDVLINWFTSLHHSEVILYILFITLFLLLLINFAILRHSLFLRSYVYIDLTSGTNVLMLKLKALPDATRYFSIQIPTGTTKLTLQNFFFFGILSFQSPWIITNTLTKQRTTLPHWIIIRPSQIAVATLLLQNPASTILPLIVHNHEFVYFNSPSTSLNRFLPSDASSLVV